MVEIVEAEAPSTRSYTSILSSFSSTCASASVSAGLLLFTGHALSEGFNDRYMDVAKKYHGFDPTSPENANMIMSAEDAEEFSTNYKLYGLTMDSLMFTSNTLLSRILDSFEYYMQSLIKIIILSRPTLMNPSRAQNGNEEFKIGISLIVDSVDKGSDDLMTVIVDSYIKSILSGPTYRRAIDFITNKIGSRRNIVTPDEMKLLDALYRARNSITHEDGVIREKEWLALGELVRPNSRSRRVSHSDMTGIALELCEVAFRLEDVVRDGFSNERWFLYSRDQIREPLESHYKVFSSFIKSHPFYASRINLN